MSLGERPIYSTQGCWADMDPASRCPPGGSGCEGRCPGAHRGSEVRTPGVRARRQALRRAWGQGGRYLYWQLGPLS